MNHSLRKKEKKGILVLLPDMFERMAVQAALVASLQGGVRQPVAENGTAVENSVFCCSCHQVLQMILAK